MKNLTRTLALILPIIMGIVFVVAYAVNPGSIQDGSGNPIGYLGLAAYAVIPMILVALLVRYTVSERMDMLFVWSLIAVWACIPVVGFVLHQDATSLLFASYVIFAIAESVLILVSKYIITDLHGFRNTEGDVQSRPGVAAPYGDVPADPSTYGNLNAIEELKKNLSFIVFKVSHDGDQADQSEGTYESAYDAWTDAKNLSSAFADRTVTVSYSGEYLDGERVVAVFRKDRLVSLR